ncbi:hypothetical protein VTN77DRAFT_5856 [Rasamsonia byssochlamydoides]|uniref:uncharacterized protein n=1 Tax=Rasamsonia byssochlamydoides TaxID=89139 RepID=UPI00374243AC
MPFASRLWASVALVLSIAVPGSSRLVGIPTVPFNISSPASFPLHAVNSIVVDAQYANATDLRGTTLIPPTLEAFAETFAEDLRDYIGHVPVSLGSSARDGSIFLTLGNAEDFLDAASRPTSEGYTLSVTERGVTITGASPLGVWWGTRTILQQAALADGKLPVGSGTDAPGWGVRGVMLDAGRHYYPPEFLIEICSYLSFFKQNTFHVHLSDNLYNNVDEYSLERSLELYAAFRPNSDDPAVAGLNTRANESYYRSDFEEIQQKCHALVITQWKLDLAISSGISLLNISNPDTIPTVESIWRVFLPWFHSKTVHIGADEYVDAALSKDALVGEYTYFVNSMNSFISNSTGKSIRIWGTFPPSSNATNVDTSVSIQHWEFFEANPYWDFIKNGYNVLNSDDAFYIVNKYSGSYPQELNITRIFYGAPDGGPYAPYIFDTKNATNNPPRDNPAVLGHVAALWNDDGPNATTYSEAYYAWRNGLPALADKQWGGDLLEDDYASIFDTLHAEVPAQNLDRAIPSKSSTIVQYSFTDGSTKIKDLSGNGYDATTNCSVSKSAISLTPSCSISTPLGSKGRNYTLSFSVYPTANTTGALFTGPDSALLSGNGTSPEIMLVAAGNAFALNYSLPLNTWTHASLIGRGNQTFFGLGNGTELEFLTKIGVDGEYFVWAPMAIEAPLATIGGGFTGLIKDVKLVDYA